MKHSLITMLITAVLLPLAVQHSFAEVFHQGDSITITVESDESDYSTITITGKGFVSEESREIIQGYSSTTDHVIIENGITGIPVGLFSQFSRISQVSLPESLTAIGDSAFSGCGNLPSIDIPDGVTSIGNGTFFGCTSLATVSLPESLTAIGATAFYHCGNLVSIDIPDGVTSIGYDAFSYCTSLATASLPESLTDIGAFAFYHCGNLVSIDIPDGVTFIGYGVFADCTSLASIDIPDGVTSIGISAFSGCTSLATVSLPESLTGIGYYAFSGCKSLASIDIPDGVPVIDDWTFSGCTSLAAVSLPESLNYIGAFAFSDCKSLASIDIPDGVTAIGNSAFDNCTSLAAVSLPEGLIRIIDSAFSGCESLASIDIPDGVPSIGDWAFSGCTSLAAVSLPESLTAIGDSAFYYCSNLASIDIPDGVTSIGDRAFDGCTSIILPLKLPENLTYIGDYPFPPCDTAHDTVISLPEKLTHIGRGAFSGWPVMVMKLNSIGYIGSGAFYGCPLDSVILPLFFDMDINPYDEDFTNFTSPFGGCSLKYVEICCPHSADNTSYLFDRESLSTDTIYIPPYESEDYWRQWNWGGDLEFIEKGGISLTAHLSEDVSLVSAIVEAGYRPEDDIHTLNLYGILSPEDISLITDNMPRLRLLNLSGVHNSVLDGFSTGDLSCVEVRLPYLSEIPDSAFCNSGSLDALAFPNMSGRSSTFDIPCCVTSIGRRAFAGLSRIGCERIIIPSSVSELGDSAFASIPSLRYFEFGSGIDTIRSPFTSASVDTIVLHSSVPPVVLGDLPVDKNSCILQVPIDGYDYFSDPFWKNFRNIQRIDMSSDTAAFSVSVSASGKGTVSYNGIPCGSAAVKVTCGLFSILPDDGWIIDRVLFNGIDCTSSVSGAGDLYLPAQDGHLDVSFAEATHTVEFFISKRMVDFGDGDLHGGGYTMTVDHRDSICMTILYPSYGETYVRFDGSDISDRLVSTPEGYSLCTPPILKDVYISITGEAPSTSVEPSALDKSLDVYAHDGMICCESGTTISGISLFDISGRSLSSVSCMANRCCIHAPVRDALLFVRVTFADGSSTTVKIIL